MNILYINTLDERGGAAKVMQSIARGVKKRGHNVSVFVSKKQSKDENVFKIQRPYFISKLIKRLTDRDVERFLREKIDETFPNDISFFNMKGLFNSNEYKNADIIHLHNISGNYFNLSSLKRFSDDNKKIVWTLHDMWALTPNCVHTPIEETREGLYVCEKEPKNVGYLIHKKKKFYSTKFTIASPSQWLISKIEKTVLKDKPLKLVHNGVNTHTFKRHDKKSVREELSLPQDKKIISFFAHGGTTNPWKGWKYVEEIIKHYSDNENAYFLCLGGNKNLQQKNISYIEYIDDDKLLSKYYSASDLLLFPSTAENFPLTTLEAMSCGLPVVSFDVGGVKEQIEHGKTGYIAKTDDIEDFFCGINTIITMNQKQYEEMSDQATLHIKNKFDENKMITEYIDIYNLPS